MEMMVSLSLLIRNLSVWRCLRIIFSSRADVSFFHLHLQHFKREFDSVLLQRFAKLSLILAL